MRLMVTWRLALTLNPSPGGEGLPPHVYFRPSPEGEGPGVRAMAHCVALVVDMSPKLMVGLLVSTSAGTLVTACYLQPRPRQDNDPHVVVALRLVECHQQPPADRPVDCVQHHRAVERDDGVPVPLLEQHIIERRRRDFRLR